MCGIIGCYRKEGVTENDIESIYDLIQLNIERGQVSCGIITPTKLYKSTNILNLKFDLLYMFIDEEYLFIHLRAPTGEGQNNLELTQPFVVDNKVLLFNGILTEWNKKVFKNDTYHILDLLDKQGLDSLQDLKGSFALCWKDSKDDIYLVRCINSLYYDNNFFSSTKFKDSKELKHGEILDFKIKKITKFDCYTPYEIIEKEVSNEKF
jgi:asparagine synthetase B (glutamine-hydrolysing)